jgi:hypothetical protein
MRKVWVTMSEDPKFAPISNAIEKGIAAIDKWYKKVDNTSAYFITLGLLLLPLLCSFHFLQYEQL